jgi:hypothetical protein
MPVQLNHTIVSVRDKRESAVFLAEILGLDAPEPYGPFLVVRVDNEVSLDSQTTTARSTPSTTRSWSASPSSMRSSVASKGGGCRTWPIRGGAGQRNQYERRRPGRLLGRPERALP